MGKFEDFARDEIYAFHRLTAIFTTFLLAAGFTVLAVKGDLGKPLVRWSFIGLVVIGSANILLIWWRMKKTIFKFYSKLEDEGFKETELYKNIRDNEETWQRAIWFSFLGSFAVFFGFLVVVLFI